MPIEKPLRQRKRNSNKYKPHVFNCRIIIPATFTFITRQSHCPRRLIKLCFTTPSLAGIKMGTRLGVVKQSFFSLGGQYGWRVIKVNWWERSGLTDHCSVLACQFGKAQTINYLKRNDPTTVNRD